MLDRNGLRPARYELTKDGLFVLASETGVLDLPQGDIVRRGRLKPGEILWCDLQAHRLVLDAELKNTIARQAPYRRWSHENKIPVAGLFDTIAAAKVPDNLREQQRLFGWTQEDIDLLVRPMVETGHEPVGSMGNDAALAVLSPRPQLLFNYFKQRFAQVTNPPIDPIREELVMSLTTYIGNCGNILSEAAHRASVIRLARPVLTGGDLARLMVMEKPRGKVRTLSIGWKNDLLEALSALEKSAVSAVQEGIVILVLSDRGLPEGELPIPSLLASPPEVPSLPLSLRRSKNDTPSSEKERSFTPSKSFHRGSPGTVLFRFRAPSLAQPVIVNLRTKIRVSSALISSLASASVIQVGTGATFSTA